MNSVKYVIADVFTNQRFGGNQLAVFTDARGLTDATMQDIAREMKFSETTFLLPPESGGDFRVRIFTPMLELPFAGHPLVGSGNVIVAEKMKQWSKPITSVTLETGVGPILVEVNTDEDRAGYTTMNQPLPVVKKKLSDYEAIASALTIEAGEIEKTGLPIEAIYNGITTIIVPVRSRAAIENIKVDLGKVEDILTRNDAETIMTFTRETARSTSDVHCRVFAPDAGSVEDAATGSANGPLGFYLVRHRAVEVKAVTSIISEQGFEMRRPSTLHIDVEVDANTNEVVGIRVGGDVVIAGRGEILLS